MKFLGLREFFCDFDRGFLLVEYIGSLGNGRFWYGFSDYGNDSSEWFFSISGYVFRYVYLVLVSMFREDVEFFYGCGRIFLFL